MAKLAAQILDVVVSFPGCDTETIAAEVHAPYAETRAILGELRDQGKIQGATDAWRPVEVQAPKPGGVRYDADVERVLKRNIAPVCRNTEISRQIQRLRDEMTFVEDQDILDMVARHPGISCAEIASELQIGVHMLDSRLGGLASLGLLRRENGSPVEWYPRRTRAERMAILACEYRDYRSMPRKSHRKTLHRIDVVRFLSECSSAEILGLCEEAEQLYAIDPTTMALRKTMIAAKREGLL